MNGAAEPLRHTLPSGAVVHTWKTAGPPHAVVILQHGYREYAHRYVTQHARLIPRLGAAGYEVRALDLWGHGHSPGRRGVTSTRLAIRDHLAVRELAARRGLPVVLFGHSLGGLVTAGSVTARPDGVAGVVLTSPALPRWEGGAARRLLGAMAAAAPALPIPRPSGPPGVLSRDPEVDVLAVADPLMSQGQVRVLTAATSLDAAAEVRRRAPDWRVPLLLAHGTADLATDPGASRELYEAIPAEDKTLTLVDGAYHELLNDHCAADVLTLLLTWIADRTRSA